MKYENVINKESVKKQSIMIILMLAFIIGFKSIFGNENILIGVTTITAVLMFINVDLTISPMKNLIKLIILNVITGVGAYLALSNPWIGIPINFAMIFVINYILYFNLKESLYLPFALQYVFILSSPITLDRLPVRIAALLITPVAIMIVQIIFNRQKVFKKGNRIIENVCSKIINKIDIILAEDSTEVNNLNIDNEIRKYIDEFRAIVYDNRKEKFYITEEARIKINILSSLEKISIKLNKIDDIEGLKGILTGLRQCMKRLNVVLGEDNNIEELEKHITKVINKYENAQVSRIYVIEIINSLEILKVSLAELRQLGKENYNNIKYSENKTDNIPDLIRKKRFMINSLKLSFAIRSAIGISLTAFITDYFNLSEGKWLIFTALLLIIPIYESSLRKSRDRLISTLVGAITVIILFTIFKDITIRSIILMFVGYVNSYLNEYRYKTVCTTIVVMGAASLLGSSDGLIINRIIFIISGIVVAMIINTFILPRRVEEYTKGLERMYLESVKAMLRKVYLSPTENNTHGMNNLFIITALIESRLENNKEFLNKRAKKSISQNRLLVLNIHELYILFSSDKFKNIDSKYIIEDMKLLTSFTDQNIKELLDKIEKHIKKSENIYNKLMLENIREVYKEIHKINKYL